MPLPSVRLFLARGYLDLPMAHALMQWSDDAAASVGRFHAFHDWEAVENYEPQARTLLTQHVRKRSPRFLSAHMLVKSRAVAMGVVLANGILGGTLTAHHRRESFETALADVIKSLGAHDAPAL